MKIGILTKAMDNTPTGIGRYAKNLVENLIKIDKTNEYFFIHYKKSDQGFYKNKNEIVIKRYTWLPKILNDSLAFLFIDKYHLDVIHEVSQINFLFPLKAKTVITVHDIYFLINEKNLIKKFLLKLLYNYIYKRADKLIADSESTKKDLIKHLGLAKEKIQVIRGAVEPSFKVIQKRKSDRKKSPYILFVGTLEPRKNLERLIKAFYQFKVKTDYKHNLIMVGEKGWKYQAIFKKVKSLNLNKEVVFTGHVTNNNLILLYNQASLLVFPSLYEGLGLPPLEAMACGCPVITSKISSLPEYCGKAAYYINPYDTKQLTKAIVKVLADKKLKRRMVELGLAQVKKFSWKKTAKKTMLIYNSLL